MDRPAARLSRRSAGDPALISALCRRVRPSCAVGRRVLRARLGVPCNPAPHLPAEIGRPFPTGAARLLVRWARWVSDAEARPLIREAAGRELQVSLGDGVVKHSGGDAQRYLMLTTRHDQRVKGRAVVTAVVAVPVSVCLVAATLTLPVWAIGVGITGVLALLG